MVDRQSDLIAAAIARTGSIWCVSRPWRRGFIPTAATEVLRCPAKRPNSRLGSSMVKRDHSHPHGRPFRVPRLLFPKITAADVDPNCSGH